MKKFIPLSSLDLCYDICRQDTLKKSDKQILDHLNNKYVFHPCVIFMLIHRHKNDLVKSCVYAGFELIQEYVTVACIAYNIEILEFFLKTGLKITQNDFELICIPTKINVNQHRSPIETTMSAIECITSNLNKRGKLLQFKKLVGNDYNDYFENNIFNIIIGKFISANIPTISVGKNTDCTDRVNINAINYITSVTYMRHDFFVNGQSQNGHDDDINELLKFAINGAYKLTIIDLPYLQNYREIRGKTECDFSQQEEFIAELCKINTTPCFFTQFQVKNFTKKSLKNAIISKNITALEYILKILTTDIDDVIDALDTQNLRIIKAVLNKMNYDNIITDDNILEKVLDYVSKNYKNFEMTVKYHCDKIMEETNCSDCCLRGNNIALYNLKCVVCNKIETISVPATWFMRNCNPSLEKNPLCSTQKKIKVSYKNREYNIEISDNYNPYFNKNFKPVLNSYQTLLKTQRKIEFEGKEYNYSDYFVEMTKKITAAKIKRNKFLEKNNKKNNNVKNFHPENPDDLPWFMKKPKIDIEELPWGLVNEN